MEATVGRTVHYVGADGQGEVRCQAAVIVRVWDGDMVNLDVFIDGTNDDPTGDGRHNLVQWKTSVHQSETAEPQTWHDPRECPNSIDHTTKYAPEGEPKEKL